jgi:hypothetical protein
MKRIQRNLNKHEYSGIRIPFSNFAEKLKPFTFFLLVLLFGLAILETGCEKDSAPCACGIDDPLNNLEWMKPYIGASNIEIYLVDYADSSYIAISPLEMTDGQIVIYDCRGNNRCEWGGTTDGICMIPSGFTSDYDEANKQLIYKLKIIWV